MILGFVLIALKVVGLCKLIELMYRFGWMLKRHFRTTDHLSQRYGAGSWAVITGGNDGIGFQIARELAKQGFNIVLISRSQEKLDLAAEQIKTEFRQVEVKIIQFDFSASIEVSAYEKVIMSQLRLLDVSILVNNAGYMKCGDFARVSMEDHKQMIDVNVMPCIILTKLLMDQMMKRNFRSGAIFVTSVNALTPLGGSSTYGACKILVDYLARGISYENREKMDIISYQCGLVKTKFNGYYKENMFCISPEKAAKGILSDLGFEFMSHGHIQHDFYGMFLRKMSEYFYFRLQSMSRIRANRVLSKLQKQY